MQDRPTAEELAAAARAALLDNVAPSLTGEARKETLMAANALAMIERELKWGAEVEREELASLSELLGAGEESQASTPREQLTQLNRRLVDKIRGGEFDDPGSRRNKIARFLRGVTIAKLRISNPKLLAWEEQADAPQQAVQPAVSGKCNG